MKKASVIALFDTQEHLPEQVVPKELTTEQRKDFNITRKFLACYVGSQGTFNSYRREVERLLQWSWVVSGKSLKKLKREDIENFIRFCQQPPKAWIGLKKSPRFIEHDDRRIPNPEWRPFVATVSKAEHRNGLRPNKKDYEISSGTLKESLAILSSFFNYLLQEEFVSANPVALIRQKSKFIRKAQTASKIRRLTPTQWESVIRMAEKMAKQNPTIHERTLFIVTALYAMYLRISELTATARWTPLMNHFFRDSGSRWWFTTVGKGNKQRDIAVSDAMLSGLKRWRQYLNLTPLPTPADDSALIPKIKGRGPLTNSTYIREIVQQCFDSAINDLKQQQLNEEADALLEATVHWLRHTGISDDVKIRPREHVRDDAGHSSGAITDQYIDVNLRDRNNTAKKKKIVPVGFDDALNE